ncbi:MAG TPA: helix-turn-helix transcriptional regulator [Allosphingosinicella sp.]|nr:helix-turn-helix transcriptional regulator [Allosphingosinicella sp.]
MKAGERIRALREAKCWTQAHLAGAAGLSLRTVQRLENDHSASRETLLAIAAVLEIDVQELMGEARLEERSAGGSYAPLLRPRPALAWGALLTLPCMVFVLLNLLKYGVGVAAPYDAAAQAGASLGLADAFMRISPPLFLGGPLLALVLILIAHVTVRGSWGNGALSVSGVELRSSRSAIALTAAATASLLVLVGYLAVENLAHLRTALSAAGA